ncbi:MAG: hypothetical protein M1826_005434, partial [Phylliscum demangeonii]
MSTQGKQPDRTMSPGGMSEEERRELIARQHRALYGHDAGPAGPDPTRALSSEQTTPRGSIAGPGAPAPLSAGLRGASPLSYEPYA